MTDRFVTVLIEQVRYIEGCVNAQELEDMTTDSLVDVLREQGETWEKGGEKILRIVEEDADV